MAKDKEHVADKAEERAEERAAKQEHERVTIAEQRLDARMKELHDDIRGRNKDRARATVEEADAEERRRRAMPVGERAQLLADEKFTGQTVTGNNDKRYAVYVPRDSALPKLHIPAGNPREAVQRYDEVLGVTDKEHTPEDHDVVLLTL